MNIQRKKHPTMTKPQSGVVLVISLIMLIALTIIGITGSSVTGLEEKMAANSKDINLAFQAAEAALRDVEVSLVNTQPTFDYSTSNSPVTCATGQGVAGVYTLVYENGTPRLQDTTANNTMPCSDFFSTVDWNATSNPKYEDYNNGTSNPKLKGIYHAPRYIIEQVTRTPQASSGTSGGVSEAGAGKPSAEKVDVVLRITARGWGSNENSVVTLQSVIKVTY